LQGLYIAERRFSALYRSINGVYVVVLGHPSRQYVIYLQLFACPHDDVASVRRSSKASYLAVTTRRLMHRSEVITVQNQYKIANQSVLMEKYDGFRDVGRGKHPGNCYRCDVCNYCRSRKLQIVDVKNPLTMI
jgi:hypothetical protein